jgi:PTH1 family peptidyl-tRNA hydrolase
MDSTPLIVALGNPGPQYETTRHNYGFLVADALLELARGRKSMALKTVQTGGDFELYSLAIGSRACLLLKPLTFMNLSGKAVARVLGRHGASAQDMLVMHDELDLPLGRMKLKRGGGSNGHKGVDSIVEHTGTADFMRLRLGIGRPQHAGEVVHWVLEPFTPADMLVVGQLAQAAIKGLTLLMRRGMTEAVQLLNAFQPPESNAAAQGMDTPGALE